MCPSSTPQTQTHTPVPSTHTREGKVRPKRTPAHATRLQLPLMTHRQREPLGPALRRAPGHDLHRLQPRPPPEKVRMAVGPACASHQRHWRSQGLGAERNSHHTIAPPLGGAAGVEQAPLYPPHLWHHAGMLVKEEGVQPAGKSAPSPHAIVFDASTRRYRGHTHPRHLSPDWR